MDPPELLILTDSSNHKTTDTHRSLYPLVQKLCECASLSGRKGAAIYVANAFWQKDTFSSGDSDDVWCAPLPVGGNFDWAGLPALRETGATRKITEFSAVLLRTTLLSQPLAARLEALPGLLVINRPSGVAKCGTKEFLLQNEELRALCTPQAMVGSVDEALRFAAERAGGQIVLKPVRGHGGDGIVRLRSEADGASWRLWTGENGAEGEVLSDDARAKLDAQCAQEPMLACRFLRRAASGGDKRVLVVRGVVCGASLRLPKTGEHWLCNAHQGGTSHRTDVTDGERDMAARCSAVLEREGVYYFGMDTLEDDDGNRVLSELNCQCPGGMLPAQEVSGEPVVERCAKGLWSLVEEHIAAQQELK